MLARYNGVFLNVVAFLAVAGASGVVQASDPTEAAFNPDRTVAIRVDGEPAGTGSWLDANTVVTASHFFLNVRDREHVQVEVVWRGERYQATLRNAENPAYIDASVLDIDGGGTNPVWRGAPLALCEDALQAGQPVRVGLRNEQGIATLLRSYGSPDEMVMYQDRASSTAITAFLKPGDSGASVYDEAKGRMVGLVSLRQKVADDWAEVYTTKVVSISNLIKFLNEEDSSNPRDNKRQSN